MVTVTEVSTNRYAPSGADSVNMYGTELAGDSTLTLGQLVIAVSMRSAAAYEAQSVAKMNRITAGSEKLEKASEYMPQIADGSGEWAEIKAFLTGTLGITDALPDGIDTYAKRMTAITALKAKVDMLTQSQQEDMIDLQTLVNRRDVSYSASSNIVRAFGTSLSGNAGNF